MGRKCKLHGYGAGAVAGPTNPFVNPLVIQVGPGSAGLDYDVSFSPGVITITGMANFNTNGFLELAVLNVNGLSQEFVSNILADFGSIERAVALNAISPTRVLSINREGGSLLTNGTFSVSIDIGALDPSDVVVTGLAHAVSDVPEPSPMFLLGTGLTALALKIRRWRSRSG